MGPIRSIAVLFHERDRGAPGSNFRIWPLVANWREMGIRVEPVYGILRRVEADVLVPHVDLSYIPDDYWAFIQGYPRVVNRRVRDIRKTAVSQCRVRPGDGWGGPVIVKTVGNCGGFPDVWFGPRRKPSLWSRARTRAGRTPWIQARTLRWARTLTRYPVFESAADVPRGVWKNRHLLVERFLPERHERGYALRMLIVLGDRTMGRLLVSADTIVKNATAALLEIDTHPPEIHEARRRLGLDYGKMDYIIHEGRGVLLDVNTTPTLSGDAYSEEYKRNCADLAAGIRAFEGAVADGHPEATACSGSR